MYPVYNQMSKMKKNAVHSKIEIIIAECNTFLIKIELTRL